MAFNIKDERVVDVARAMAAQTGESLSEAIARAIEERASRVSGEREARRARVMRVLQRCHEIVGPDGLPDHGDLLYDPDTGLPR